MTPSTRLRLCEALSDGKSVLGTFMMLKSAWTAKTVAATGLDFVIVDCEHGNIGDSDMHDSVNAVADAGASPVVRIRGTDPTLIKRALDCGVHALLVPMVSTPEQAEGVVRAAKFPPLGDRGQGSPFSGSAFGLSTSDYVKQANDIVKIMVQIENKRGLANVDAICRVPGVDLAFIGPNDLAMSVLGYAPARYDEPVFLRAIETIKTAAKGAGIKIGILAADGATARRYIQDGYDMVAIGGDVKAIQGWYRQQLEACGSV